MDKQTKIILGVIIAIIVALVVVVFALDSDTVVQDKNTLITVNGTDWSIDDYYIYEKLTNFAAGDINKVISGDEVSTMMDSFVYHTFYAETAKKNNVSLESSEVEDLSASYEASQATFENANISKEDYIRVKGSMTLANKIQNNFTEYFDISDSDYKIFVDSYKDSDEYKSYSFRIMMLSYEDSAKTSGDETNIVESGDENTVNESGDETKVDKSKETVLALSNSIIDRLNSGEDFETLSNEYGGGRITFAGGSYVFINGGIEYAVGPLLKDKLGSDEVYNEVINLNAGEVSSAIDVSGDSAFYIVKVETIDDGFVGESSNEFREILTAQYSDSLLINAFENNYELNQIAYLKIINNI